MIVAIDPGKSGGIASMNCDGIVGVIPMPETQGDIVDAFRMLIVEGSANTTFVMEKLTGFAGSISTGSTMFTMAAYYWPWIALCQYAGVRMELVTPQAWQKVLGLGTKESTRGASTAAKSAAKRDWKNKLKERAQQLYPTVKVTLKTADALLLLEYANKIHSTPF